MLYFLQQNMITLTIYFSGLAKINTGLVVSVWTLCPFGYALTDRVIFGYRLKMHHYIGLVLIMASAVLLSLSSVIYPEKSIKEENVAKPIPAVIPVVFSLMVPCVFVASGILQKHLTSEKGGGFDNDQLIFSSVLLVNVIVMFFAIIYWSSSDSFNTRLFVLGFITSIFDTIGKFTWLTSMNYGPGAPTSAIVNLSSPLLVIMQALVYFKMIKPTEFLALIICFLGSFILLIPNVAKRILCLVCIKSQIRRKG